MTRHLRIGLFVSSLSLSLSLFSLSVYLLAFAHVCLHFEIRLSALVQRGRLLVHHHLSPRHLESGCCYSTNPCRSSPETDKLWFGSSSSSSCSGGNADFGDDRPLIFHWSLQTFARRMSTIINVSNDLFPWPSVAGHSWFHRFSKVNMLLCCS